MIQSSFVGGINPFIKHRPEPKCVIVTDAPQSIKHVTNRKVETLAFIKNNPGATVAQLKPLLQMEDRGIGRILRSLRLRGRITRVAEDGVWQHYIVNDALLSLIDQHKQILINALEEQPGMMLTRLAERCGRTPNGTQSLLVSLIKSGLVKRSWSADQRWFYEMVP